MYSRKTIFVDLDGTVFAHKGDPDLYYTDFDKALAVSVLPGVYEKWKSWVNNKYIIVITTGRSEELREITEAQLEHSELVYDYLIMGLPRGPRIVVNDSKPDTDIETAVGITTPRNEGLINVNI